MAHIAGHFKDIAAGCGALAAIKFPVSRGPPLSNQCTADTIRFLLATFSHSAERFSSMHFSLFWIFAHYFKDADAYSFLQLAGTQNTLFTADQSSAGETEASMF